MKKCIIAGLMLLAVSSAFALEPETIAYTNRCGGTLDPLFVEQVDRFIKGGKEAGWWNNLIAVHFFCAPNSTAAVVNAKSTNMTLTAIGGITHTPYEGFSGNGSSGYLESSRTPSNLISSGFTTTSHSMFVFSQTDNRSATAAEVGTMGPVTIAIGAQACSTNGYSRIWPGGTNSALKPFWITNAVPTAKGLTGFVRSSLSGGYAVRDTEAVDFSDIAAGTLPAGTIRYFRLGTQGYYSSNQLSFGFIGKGNITRVQAEDLYYRCVEMLVGLGSWTEAGTELQSYIDRAPADTEWNAAFLISANRFIARAKAAGWWNKMKAIHFLCAPGEGAAKLNIRGTNFNLTKGGTVTFTTNSGAQGNGINGYLDTGATLTDFGLSPTGHSMFVYSQSDNPSLGSEIGAMGPSPCVLGIRIKNLAQASVWSGTNLTIAFPVQSGIGLTGFVRNSTNGGFWVKNSGSGDFLRGTGGVPASTISYLHSWISSYYSENKLAFGFIGDSSITKSNAADMYLSCVEMLDGMGTQELALDPEVVAPPHCFGRGSLTNVTPAGMEVLRFTPPPSSDSLNFRGNPPAYTNGGFAYGPISDAITRPWGWAPLSTDTQVGRWELIWSDRANCGWGGKPNDTMGVFTNFEGKYCATEFTTYSNAVGSTLIKTAYSAGMKFRNDPDYGNKGWGDIAEEWGYDVSIWDTYWRGGAGATNDVFKKDVNVDTGDIAHRKYYINHVDQIFTNSLLTYKTSRDRVILGQGRLCDLNLATGFLIDHEHADDRSPDLELKYIIEMRKIAQSKGLKMAAGGEAPASGVGIHTGWTITNAWQILTNLEFFVILAAQMEDNPAALRADMDSQYNFFKGPNGDKPVPASRLCLQLICGTPGQEMTTNEAAAARQFVIDKGITKCAIPPGYAAFGGDISRNINQLIATFLGLSTVTNTP